MTASLSQPFKLFACTPSRLKLLIMSVSMCISLGFAVFTDSAFIPNVRYLVFVSPLFPASIWLRRIPEYSSLTSSNPSFLCGMAMLFSKSDTSVAMLQNEIWNLTELSKKLRKEHHSSNISVLSSCSAN